MSIGNIVASIQTVAQLGILYNIIVKDGAVEQSNFLTSAYLQYVLDIGKKTSHFA